MMLAFVFAGSLAFAQTPFDIANQHVRANYEDWGLTAQDVDNMVVSDLYTDQTTDITRVVFQQQHQGIPVYNALMNLSITAEGEVFFVGKRFVPELASKVNTTVPVLTPEQAVQALVAHLGLANEDLRLIDQPSTQEFVFEKGNIAIDDIKVKLNYQQHVSGALLAWDVTLFPVGTADMWSTRIDAVTGDILNEHNWTVYCDIGPNTYAHHHDHDCASHSFDNVNEAPPALVPNSYNVWPVPYESPNHGPRTLMVDPADLDASPNGWHDTDGMPGAEFTITRGNNVHAYEDTGNADQSQDNEPDGGVDLEFDFDWDPLWEPPQFRDAAVVNLFYWNNVMHDFAWHYGMNEALGNFQLNNYGNGGQGNDYVLAEAQDGGGTNNANFATPPDGGNGRMQMYLWGASGARFLEVNAPASIAGDYDTGLGQGWGQVTDVPVTAEVVIVEDGVEEPYSSDGCEPILNGGELEGKIALIDRGGCEFGFKALQAENEGAIGAIICNFENETINMGAGAVGGQVTIPTVFLSSGDCQTIRQFVGNGLNVTLAIPTTTGPSELDGDLDNGIIAHEFAHGISNRLTGGPGAAGCLFGNEQMGEGWSDFATVAMTVKEGDTGEMKRGVGTYATSEPIDGTGIRPYAYTTDMELNPQTYGMLPNYSIPHGVGSVWCAMLWEVYWAFVDEYGFDENLYTGTGGNNMAIRLVFEGMKSQPCGPGFVDGRDAILAADEVLYGGANQCLIWKAFAKRGLGINADQGSVENIGDETEDFEIPCPCRDKVSIEKSMTPTINAGEEIQVNLLVSNCKTETVTGVVVADQIPAGATFKVGSSSLPADVQGDVVSFNLDDMPSETDMMITYTLISDPDVYSVRYFLDDVPEEDAEDNWEYFFIGNSAPNIFIIIDAFGGNNDDWAWFTENIEGESRQELVLNPDEVTWDINLARPTLRFYHKYNTEPGADGGVVDVKEVGTTTWRQVQDNMLRNGYPGGIQYGTFVVPDLDAFSGFSGDNFEPTYVDLSEFADQTVHMRFRFGTNDGGTPGGSFEGWLIDDIEYMDLASYNGEVCVTTAEGDNECTIAPEEGTIVESQWPASATVDQLQDVEVATFPNPAGDILNVQLSSENRTELNMSLLTVDGKEMLSRDLTVRGNQHVSLNVSQVPAGLYFLRVSSDEGVLTQKVIVE